MIKLRWLAPIMMTMFGLGGKAMGAPASETEPAFLIAIGLFSLGLLIDLIDEYTPPRKPKNGGFIKDLKE